MRLKLTKLFAFIALTTLISCSDQAEVVKELTSNDPGTATIRIFKNDSSTDTKSRYISPKQVDIKFTYNTLSGVLSNNENVCPSIGDVNLLVIPVHLPGGTVNTEEVRNDIEKTFFGKDDSDNGYMSVSEYYYQSSFGKLNFQGIVTDWFDVANHTSIDSLDDITMGTGGTIISEILREATDWAFENYDIDRKDYDYNNDGSLDGIWLVYDHHNYFTQYQLDTLETGSAPDVNDPEYNEAFWNFTSWDWYGDAPSLEAPTTSGFSWASYDQMYLGYADYDSNDNPILTNTSNIPLDSHTYIHETGHLLGLDDYYTSSSLAPMGRSTMMDQNVGDLDPYSKLVLGWVTPYVVYGSSEILLPHNTYNDHSVIVIPANYDEISSQVERAVNRGNAATFRYQFNPFSEYLLIDLYSPLGNDYEDTYGDLIHARERCLAGTGVRIYHVDSRIFKCTVTQYDGGSSIYFNYNDLVWDGEELESNQAVMTCISNDYTESAQFGLDLSYDYFERVRLLESSGTNSFNSGEYANEESTLWDEEDAPFDIATFGLQFFNGNYTYNDGTSLPFKIQVDTLRGVEL